MAQRHKCSTCIWSAAVAQASAAVIIAISCIVGGCIVLVSFGSHSSRPYTYQDLLSLYGKPAYVCYMVIGAAVVLAAYAGFWIGQRQVR
jgi:hypothetical protein